ncbi:MAG TPA: sigma 54-interacting transcriptional regulator [Terriglobales bacterium]|nr:sigma 54-interacting transcriptional regulator [Terriglobales bacterium]
MAGMTVPSFSREMLIAAPGGLWREQEAASGANVCGSAISVGSGAEALAQLQKRSCRTLVLHRHLPDLDADEVAKIARRRFPELEIMFLDEVNGWSMERSQFAPGGRGLTLVEPQREKECPGPVPRIVDRQPLPGMIGNSEPMLSVCQTVRRVAPRMTTVLITGETGTGKELVARALHQLSPRAHRPFAVVSCAAIPEALLESELFGYSRGAFTGAVQSQAGRICAAQGGTLFLDEIGEMPLSMQAKLLRFLEQREVQRLGSSELQHVDVRVVAATNADLARLVAARQFRQDLFYRLAVFSIELPPLQQRRADIPALARYFLANLAAGSSPIPRPTDSALQLLMSHSWPGNVRELQLVMERAWILADGEPAIRPQHIHFPAVHLAAALATSSVQSGAF